MTVPVLDRLSEQLRVRGVERGYRKAQYRGRGTNKQLSHYSQEHVSVLAADVLAACALVKTPTEVTSVLADGCSGHPNDQIVSIQCDDLYHLIEQATAAAPAA